MATTEQGGATEATCPLCDDYRGAPSSVEAHISRMTDPVHKGEVGRAHRDHLQGRVVTIEDVESSDEQEVESTEDFQQDGGPRSEDRDTEAQDEQEGDDVPTVDELERQRDQWSLDDDHDDDQEDVDDQALEEIEASAGIPLPVSKTVLFGGLAVALLVIYWFRIRPARQDDSGDESDEETAQQAQQDGMTAPSGGGLMEGY